MEVNINQKFKILFRKIFKEECQISRYYADKLLKCLGDPNEHVAKHLLETPMFSDLIFNSIGNMKKLSVSNKIFTLELVTLLFRNELQFNKLQYQGFDLSMLKTCVADNLNLKSTEMYVAFIKLVTVLLTHCSGMKLVKSKKPWERILQLSIHRKSANLSMAVYEHLTNLVWKLDEYEDETTIYEVLRAILKPIHMSEYQTLEIFDVEKDKSYSEPITASLHALLAIMSETRQLTNSKCFIPILKHCYLIESPMHKVLAGTRDPDIISLIAQINFKSYFAIVSQGCVRAGRSASDFLNEIIACFVNEIAKLMRKAMIVPILEFILNVNIFWAKTGSELYSSTFERNGQKHEIEDQFLWHLMLPLITYVTVTLKCTPQEIEEYHAKMGQMLTEHITKSGYRYKTMLQRNDLKKVAIQNVKQIFRIKGLLKAKQAGTLFQSLFYLLQTFMTEDIDACAVVRDENPLQTSDDVKLLSLTLTAIKMLLTEHHITWHDNLEIICLQKVLMGLMKQNTLPTKQVLQALDLIELSTRRFLSPDMALLVETHRGGTLCATAGAMRRYAQHADWEVRDSAFTLLLACTHIAFVKYVPLQKLILEHQLIVLAKDAALTDTEYYVQVTALKCLAAAAKVESLWREVLDHNPTVCIYTQLWQILRQSPDGAVRAAAATVLTQVYVNQQTTAQFRACMHRAMAAAALDDLHSEVQLAALDYWSQVIRNHLNDRGMMDGKFPSVTFSKEKRKIIVLDEKEVKRQLAAIMNDLSAKGCLTVLHRCINEEFDIQVMERAYCISNSLVEILTCHHFDKVPENYNSPMDHDPPSESYGMALDLSFVQDTTAERDNVITELMNTKTSDLIMNLSDGPSENAEKEIPALPQMKERIHPNKFLEDLKQTDYATNISNIKNWQPETPNLSCLLDDILEYTGDIEMSDYCIE